MLTGETHRVATPRHAPAAVRRLNAICPYFTMFPLTYPEHELAGVGGDDVVLDPFCGRGTTLFAARLLGVPAFGVDVEPVAVAIARSKLGSATPAEVCSRLNELLEFVPQPAALPAGEFWNLAYEPETLAEICRVREAMLSAGPSSVDDVLRSLILGILHGPTSATVPNYLSNRMLRTYATKPGPAVAYWKKHGLKPRRVDLRQAVTRRGNHVLGELPRAVTGGVINADSRTIGPHSVPAKVTRIVTSPPYLGMRSYHPDQWLRNWFLGAAPAVDYASPGSVPPGPADVFQDGLASVWRAVATVARPGAQMSVRFGALPSVQADPETTLRTSLATADAGWKVLSVRSAGPSSRGRRQAASMRTTSVAVDEIDLRAVLAS